MPDFFLEKKKKRQNPPFEGVGAILAGFPHFGGHFGVIWLVFSILKAILADFPSFWGTKLGPKLAQNFVVDPKKNDKITTKLFLAKKPHLGVFPNLS